MFVIKKGFENKVDVSVFAKEEFEWKQMDEIRLGLEDNLDVSLYAKPEISWKEMKKIREELLKESTL